MTDYCSESDLAKIRPGIMNLGVNSWADQISEAGSMIDRAIETRWYRRLAEENKIDWRENPFDRELCLSMSSQLKRLGCYKTLELCFLYLMKDSVESDAFERQRSTFEKLYIDELKDVLDSGIDYDWDESGTVESGEGRIPQVRRLVRV